MSGAGGLSSIISDDVDFSPRSDPIYREFTRVSVMTLKYDKMYRKKKCNYICWYRREIDQKILISKIVKKMKQKHGRSKEEK